MKIKIRNLENKKSYDVDVNDSSVKDEEICPECNKPLSECECHKEEHQEEVHDEKNEKIELTEKEYEAFKDLIELLPDLKKLVGKPSKEEKEKDKEEEKEEEAEAEEDQKDDKKSNEKKDSDEDNLEVEEEEESEDIILESDDNEIVPDLDEMEEDIIEDESCDGVHDSINPGSIEKEVSDGNTDTVSHEVEVAEAWSQRYESLLHK